MRRALSVALILSLNACYTYAAVSDWQLDSGKEVRATLSPAQDFDVGTLTVRDVTQVDGTVFRSTEDTLAVWSQWLHQQIGQRYGSDGAVYYMLRGELESVEVRKLQPARTLVAVGVVVAAATGVFAFAADRGGDGGSRPMPPPPVGQLIAPDPIQSISR